MPRGDPDRIALIHAVYAAGWAIVSLGAGGVSPWPAVAILLFAIALTIGAARQLRRRANGAAPDPAADRWARRINLVTALAALLYGWALARSGHDGLAVAAVLIVTGLHLAAMWLLLRRVSLLAMGVALGAAGLVVWRAPELAATGAFLAALIFAGNGMRLALRGAADDEARSRP